ncbi:MAG TPA: cbb3-type cytochrome c oxidase subunit I [Armatimonadota bacterium]|jgi:cytochrome c oxidase cbb3-type subunit 1/cytochrome c oxidase cbb3-type subunit I/II
MLTRLRQLLNWALPAAEHTASRRFLTSAAVWFCLGTLLGLATAIEFIAPDLVAGIPWLEFGRIRAIHVGLVVFGFTTSALLGAMLYIVPNLLRTRLAAERVANLACWVWNATFVAVIITLALGYTQGREYAEWIFPVKVIVTLALVLLVYVLVMTITNRQEPVLYVSVWYGVGGVVWTALLYPLGNVMWRPATGSMGGIVDAIWLWWYGHNLFGLMITPLAIAVAYYLIPRVAQRPLYSHQLSLIGFWSMLAFYTHIGTHHLIQAPVPVWLKTVSIVDSVAMIIPVATVLINLWMTMRGSLARFADHLPGKMVFLGSIWYLVVCLQGPLQSLPSVQRYVHFNNWVIGHAHIAVLGFAGFIALGALWHLLPLVSRREIFRPHLVIVQYWLVLVGLTGFFLSLTIAGLVQGQAWVDGQSVYRVIPQIIPYLSLRAVFGTMIAVGAAVGLYNVLMTLYYGKPVVES